MTPLLYCSTLCLLPLYYGHTFRPILPWQSAPDFPGGQMHSKSLILSLHVPPFLHGVEIHSLMLILQTGPVNPGAQVHECQPSPSIHVAPLWQGFEAQSSTSDKQGKYLVFGGKNWSNLINIILWFSKNKIPALCNFSSYSWPYEAILSRNTLIIIIQLTHFSRKDFLPRPLNRRMRNFDHLLNSSTCRHSDMGWTSKAWVLNDKAIEHTLLGMRGRANKVNWGFRPLQAMFENTD